MCLTGVRQNRSPTTSAYCFFISPVLEYDLCECVWLQFNAVQTVPIVSGGSRWTLGGTSCNSHDSMWKIDEKKPSLMQLGYLSFHSVEPNSYQSVTPKLRLSLR